jgi:hypothetical protein
MKKANGIKTGLMLLSITIGLFMLCSCYRRLDHDCHGGGVIGSGAVVEEIRNVGYFDSIKILGSCKVIFRKDADQGLRLVGEDNILPIIGTWVENGTLIIDNERSYSARYEVKVYVSMQAVRGLAVASAGCIIGEDAFSTDSLFLEITGAGKIEMEVDARTVHSSIAGAGCISLVGSADRHTVSITGSGSIEAEDFEVKVYDVVVTGAGSCRIFVTQELNAVITGAGSIYYKGNPAVINTQVTGAGKIVKI